MAAPLILAGLVASGLLVAPTPLTRGHAVARADAPTMLQLGRREQLQLAGSSLLAVLSAAPQPASASYALYKAAGDTMAERKASGDWKPGSDRATLSAIQDDITRKRPGSPNKMKKPPQYCAGQTSGVQPMLENICGNIGISKADQSNAQVDNFGNMAIGIGTETAEYKRYRAAVEQAQDAQRLRDKYAER